MALDGIDLVDVVGVDHCAGKEAAQELCDEIDWKASPGELSEDAIRECYSGVEIRFRPVSNLHLGDMASGWTQVSCSPPESPAT